MIVFIPSVTEGYEFLHPVAESDFETIHVLLNGYPRGRSWTPLKMRIVSTDEGRSLMQSDAPWLGGHALAFRSKAVVALQPLLDRYGELLPVSCNGCDVKIYNSTRLVDALDLDLSIVRRFANGRVMGVEQYCFREDALRDIQIFKIPNLRVSPTFLREEFVELWSSKGLKGLSFTRVWSS
jgi:hypothetical protein